VVDGGDFVLSGDRVLLDGVMYTVTVANAASWSFSFTPVYSGGHTSAIVVTKVFVLFCYPIAPFAGHMLSKVAAHTHHTAHSDMHTPQVGPSITTGEMVLTITNDDPRIVRYRLPGAVSGAASSISLTTSVDLTAQLAVDDSVVVGGTAYTVTGVQPSSVNITPPLGNAIGSSAPFYMGSIPDSPGVLSFSKPLYSVVESDVGGNIHFEALPGTFTMSNGNPSALGTWDMTNWIVAGASVQFAASTLHA
jgi:hypothetical protein